MDKAHWITKSFTKRSPSTWRHGSSIAPSRKFFGNPILLNKLYIVIGLVTKAFDKHIDHCPLSFFQRLLAPGTCSRPLAEQEKNAAATVFWRVVVYKLWCIFLAKYHPAQASFPPERGFVAHHHLNSSTHGHALGKGISNRR
ncbi:hypothetical protein D3C75_1031860 [compost metagenome]